MPATSSPVDSLHDWIQDLIHALSRSASLTVETVVEAEAAFSAIAKSDSLDGLAVSRLEIRRAALNAIETVRAMVHARSIQSNAAAWKALDAKAFDARNTLASIERKLWLNLNEASPGAANSPQNPPLEFVAFNQTVLTILEEEYCETIARVGDSTFEPHPMLRDPRRADRRSRFESAADALYMAGRQAGQAAADLDSIVRAASTPLQAIMQREWWNELHDNRTTDAAKVDVRKAFKELWDECHKARQQVWRIGLEIAVSQPTTANVSAADASGGGEGETPADQFGELRKFARDKLRKIEQAVVLALCDSEGSLPLADLAMKPNVEWDDAKSGFKNVQDRLNPKLKPLHWRLIRENNVARLSQMGVKEARK